MARENRIRVSDEEKANIKRAREAIWGEDVAEDIPLGKVVGQICGRVADEEEAHNERTD